MLPSLPQGTRDFNAITLRRRYYITQQIRKYFELYGFEPLETPALEKLQTLMGKYGNEGDKLIFKILNNGLDNPSKKEDTLHAFQHVLSGKSDENITSRALRYDLTIPFARFVATNYHTLPLPFKRFQIQPVWRADRPQKGRYREFLQCDADVAGTYSLMADAEFAMLYRDVFRALKIPVTIKINNRKLLTGLAEITQQPDALRDITTAIDKLDKIGLVKVREELTAAELDKQAIATIESYLSINGSNREKSASLRQLLKDSETALKGVDELDKVFSVIGDDDIFELDTTLARGLDYYTGTIFEIKATTAKMGSIGGGGRYDNLTHLFGVDGVPGVGISFGIDRIYDVMEELQLFPDEIEKSSVALFLNLGEEEAVFSLKQIDICRAAGIACELYYETGKLGRQFKYAEKRKIPFVVIIGSREMETASCKIKQLATGEETTIPCVDLPNHLKEISA